MRDVSPTTSQNGARPQVAVFAFLHFVVDLACVATMLGRVAPLFQAFGPVERALSILAYDMVAFCLQLPCGAALDSLGRRCSRAAAHILP